MSLIKPPIFWQNRKIDLTQEARIKGRRPTMTEFDGELSPPFEIVEPADWRAPLLFTSPHSPLVYPSEILDAPPIRLPSLRRPQGSIMHGFLPAFGGRR